MPEQLRLKLVSARYDDQDSTNQNTGNQTNQQTPPQGSATPNDANRPAAVNPQTSPEKQQEIQDEIDVVQNRNTPFADVGSNSSGRAGDLGIDRLVIEDGFAGGSVVGGNTVRLDVAAHGLYLFSGTPTGRSKSSFGTLAPGATFPQQTASGITGAWNHENDAHRLGQRFLIDLV